MAFDPAKTMLLIAAYPDGMVRPELVAWAMRPDRPFRQVEWYIGRPVELARNRAVRDIALPSEMETFVFADRDMRPDQRTDAVLHADGDLVGATFPVGNPQTWAWPEAIHGGLFRCSRRVLETVKPPWFAMNFSPDGTTVERCECQYFRDKVKAAGFTIRRAGWAEHDVRS
jgi:hypothetical protein